MDKKKIVTILLFLFAVVAAVGIWSSNKFDDQLFGTGGGELENYWEGEELSCANFSCDKLQTGGRDFPAYHSCLVKCGDSYKKFSDEQFTVIVPASYDALAKKNLADMKNCFPLLKQTLGLVPRYNQLFITFVLNNENKDYASPEASGVYYYRTKKSLDSELLRAGASLDSSECLNAHELTHVFTGELNLPHWASEGIATYAAFKNSPDKIKCFDEGWTLSGNAQAQMIKSYSKLNKPWASQEPNAQNNWYNSAACAFQLIEQRYGQEKIPAVLQSFKKYAASHEPDIKIGAGLDQFSSDVFVNEGLVPVVGEGIREDLAEKFGL